MRKVLYLLGSLTDSDAAWIARTGTRRRINKGDILIHEGQPAEFLIVLLQGEFVVSDKSLGEIARLGVGEIVGEMSFLDAAPPSATVSAVSEGLALFLEKKTMSAKLESDVGFGCRFYRALAIFLADRLRATVHRMGYGQDDFDAQSIAKDELDMSILDTVSLAGDRFDRMLKMLVGNR
jgi:CRP-like cAMP-binding protein